MTINSSQIGISQLRQLTAFADLKDETLHALRLVAYARRLAAGDVLFQAGSSAHSFYGVLSGGLRLSEHTHQGKEVGLKLYG